MSPDPVTPEPALNPLPTVSDAEAWTGDGAEHLDVLVVGAGLSGIAAGRYLTVEHPDLTFALLEARGATGGTWDLFRYPGVRSDSDMYTLGYQFRPWTGRESMASGSAILGYLRESAAETGVDAHVRLHHRVVAADWDSGTARWRVRVEVGGGHESTRTREFVAKWIFGASGYYRYDRGHEPAIPGSAVYTGTVVHPQFWPQDLSCAGRRVAVIGSGATAMTLVPALTRGQDRAAHVTMVQRTPTYVTSLPRVDRGALALRRVLGERCGGRLVRRRNIAYAQFMWDQARRDPERTRRTLRSRVVRALGPGADVDTHFNPPYDPWDQRLCMVPDGDLFGALSSGTAEVVTDAVDSFTATGLRLASGRHVEADVVVTATGLELQFLGGARLSVDGESVDVADRLVHRGMMLAGVPNFVFAIGYTNASWTLKVDLVCARFCRLLSLLAERGHDWVRPVPDPDARPGVGSELSAGYVRRAHGQMPMAGDRFPWSGATDPREDRRLFEELPLLDRWLELGSAIPLRPAHRTEALKVAR